MDKSQKKILKHASDEQLLKMVAEPSSGWETAFSELSGRYSSYLYQRCRFNLDQAVEVEDVVQEVLFSVYRYAGHFRGESSFKTWLTHIADNQCRFFNRKQQKHSLFGNIQDLIELQESESNSTWNEKDNADLHLDIPLILQGLSQSHRQILLLRYWEDLSVQEISNCLDIGLSAAKMRVKRAIKQLSEIYLNDVLKAA